MTKTIPKPQVAKIINREGKIFWLKKNKSITTNNPSEMPITILADSEINLRVPLRLYSPSRAKIIIKKRISR
jgi:hypothetical protein